MTRKLDIELLKSIPYEGEDKKRSRFDTSYPTKIGIFDLRCNGCGFAVYKVGDMIYNNWQEAVEYAQINGERVIRECSYIQIEDYEGQVYNLDLVEVIINGCPFWNEEFLEWAKNLSNENIFPVYPNIKDLLE